ncbi:hypothetical protein LSH36_174g04055 [Paralvinella palmiformis]|uniref:Very-long-chain (3R)-3-hydroxyacyl-CoA dehydratase n=1 Tax=Paralvinella palmiformis TaxID=53620 RepID=A0AAD9JS63_9ANNE|nr:hypothetical protein LSH36_174g04055 [Paralvinella palmiformis]
MSSEKAKSGFNLTVSSGYLILYNLAQAAGWTLLAVAAGIHLIEHGTVGLYDKGHFLLNVFQTLALLEIIHPLLGLVKTGVFLTGFQVASRLFITWGIVYSVPEVQSKVGVPLFMFAWTLTEIIRYSYYIFAQVKSIPYVLQWCRYTFFIVLYPIGVSGELLSTYFALPYIKKTALYSVAMPNPANMSFSYYHICVMVMLLYIPIFPQLYMHMFAQRRKIIGGVQKKVV